MCENSGIEWPRGVHSAALPLVWAGSDGMWPVVWAGSDLVGPDAAPRIRPLGGQARTIESRQPIVAATPADSTTHVNTQAAIRLRRAGCGVRGAASRSIAVIPDGDAIVPCSTSDARCSDVSAGETELPASRSGSQLLAQRAQRTSLFGFSREAGTSYSAAQLGQARRMETHYERARIIMERTVRCFQRDSRLVSPIRRRAIRRYWSEVADSRGEQWSLCDSRFSAIGFQYPESEVRHIWRTPSSRH
jgi:hypothetical protein